MRSTEDNQFTIPGAIWYTGDDQKLRRTIQSNGHELLYEHLDNGHQWSTDLSKRRGFYFYRTANRVLKAYQVHTIGIQEFTSEVFQIIRPDLPLDLVRKQDTTWLELDSEDKVRSLLGDLYHQKVLCSSIRVIPEGPNGGHRKKDTITISADQEGVLTLGEIVKESARLQNSVNPEGNRFSSQFQDGLSKEGIGIYRLGIAKRIPVYFISNYTNAGSTAYTARGQSHNWESAFESRVKKGIHPLWTVFKTSEPNKFEVHFRTDIAGSSLKCSISRLGSKDQLAEVPLSSSVMQIDLTGLDPGIYALRISAGSYVLTVCPVVFRTDYEYPTLGGAV